MGERIAQWWHLMPDGGSGIILLLVELVVALTAMGWAYNRGYRNTERGSVLRLAVAYRGLRLGLVGKAPQRTLVGRGGHCFKRIG
jgi:hypothetical protein